MHQAMRVVSGIVAIIFLGVAIYFGLSGSWPMAVLFFLLFGGLEFLLHAVIPKAGADRER